MYDKGSNMKALYQSYLLKLCAKYDSPSAQIISTFVEITKICVLYYRSYIKSDSHYYILIPGVYFLFILTLLTSIVIFTI